MHSLRTALLVMTLASGTAYAGRLSLEFPDSSKANEVSAVARIWANALLKKDFDTLVSASFGDYQSGIRRGLSDTRSRLYKALYVEKNSPYLKLGKIQDLGIAVLAHEGLKNLGSGTTACFFGRRQPPIAWPTDSALLPRVEKQNNVYCIFLSQSAGRWEVSTDFVERR